MANIIQLLSYTHFCICVFANHGRYIYFFMLLLLPYRKKKSRIRRLARQMANEKLKKKEWKYTNVWNRIKASLLHSLKVQRSDIFFKKLSPMNDAIADEYWISKTVDTVFFLYIFFFNQKCLVRINYVVFIVFNSHTLHLAFTVQTVKIEKSSRALNVQ